MREAIFKITQVVTNIARTISNVDRNNKKYSLGSSSENNGHFSTLKMKQNVQGNCNWITGSPLRRKKISQDSRETIQFGWKGKATNPEEGCDRAVNQFCQSISLVLDVSQVAKSDDDTDSIIIKEIEEPEPITTKLTRRNAVKRKGYNIGPNRSDSDFLYLTSYAKNGNNCAACYSIDSNNFYSDTMDTLDFQSNIMDTDFDVAGDSEDADIVVEADIIEGKENEEVEKMKYNQAAPDYMSLAELRKMLFGTSRPQL